MKSKTIASVVTAAALSLVLLSGCSAVTNVVKKAVAEQSKALACAQIGAALADYGQTLTSLSTTLAKDPKDALASVKSASSKFQTAASKVTNPTIEPAVVNVSNSVGSFSTALNNTVYFATPEGETVLKNSLTGLETNMGTLEAACK